MNAPWTLLLLAALPFAIVANWAIVTFAIGSFSGWRALAAEYPDETLHNLDEPRRTFRLQSLSMRFGARYRNLVRVDVGDDGLRFSVLLPFRPGHPAFSVPWEEISTAPASGFLVKSVTLRFRRYPSVPVRIGMTLAEGIRHAGNGRFEFDDA